MSLRAASSPYVIARRQRRRSNLPRVRRGTSSARAGDYCGAEGHRVAAPDTLRNDTGVRAASSPYVIARRLLSLCHCEPPSAAKPSPPCAQRHLFRESRRLLRGLRPLAMTRGRVPPPLRCHCAPPARHHCAPPSAATLSPSPHVIASRLRRRSHLPRVRRGTPSARVGDCFGGCAPPQ